MFGGQVSIRQGSKTCLALWVTLCRVPDLSTTARADFRGDRGGGYRAGTGTSVTITHFQFGFHLGVLLSPPQYYFTWWTYCDTQFRGAWLNVLTPPIPEPREGGGIFSLVPNSIPPHEPASSLGVMYKATTSRMVPMIIGFWYSCACINTSYTE